MPDLPDRVRFTLSPRLTRCLGLCRPERGEIRLSRQAVVSRRTLDEVACHELAHVAVHLLYGPGRCRPHGPEWAALVAVCGYEPRVRRPDGDGGPAAIVAGGTPPSRPDRRRRLAFVHRCPVCQMRRTASRPVPGWRCSACRAAGLSGRLEIERVTGKATTGGIGAK